MSACIHDRVTRRAGGGWACDACKRVFYPSGETGCEQLVVRIRTLLGECPKRAGEEASPSEPEPA